MRDVNLDRIRDLAGQLRSAVRELRDYATLSADAFVADRRTVNGAKYLLIVAAESALDICNHLYWKVDDREVHRVIREDLGDLERYLAAVGKYLRSDLGEMS